MGRKSLRQSKYYTWIKESTRKWQVYTHCWPFKVIVSFLILWLEQMRLSPHLFCITMTRSTWPMLLNHQYALLLPVCGTRCDTTQTHLRDAHAGQGKPWADSVVLHGARLKAAGHTQRSSLTGASAVQTPTHPNNRHGFLCRDICCCFLALRLSVVRAHRAHSARHMCRCARQLSGAQSRG